MSLPGTLNRQNLCPNGTEGISTNYTPAHAPTPLPPLLPHSPFLSSFFSSSPSTSFSYTLQSYSPSASTFSFSLQQLQGEFLFKPPPQSLPFDVLTPLFFSFLFFSFLFFPFLLFSSLSFSFLLLFRNIEKILFFSIFLPFCFFFCPNYLLRLRYLFILFIHYSHLSFPFYLCEET